MFSEFKKKLIAVPLVKKLYKNYRLRKKRKEFEGMTNEQIFTTVYNTNKWDVNKTSTDLYYSGTGSYGEPADRYVPLINDFIKKNNIKSVTDVGCGDFAIGRQIVEKNPLLQYNGCDVVKGVVEHNRRLYGSDLVKFHHLDASKDELPSSEMLTIREVLQHLSNADIKNILSKVPAFKYAVITEHLLADGTEKQFNKDKPSGPDIRLMEGSGVYINKSPYNLDAKEVLRCRVDAFNKEAYIKSFLVENLHYHE